MPELFKCGNGKLFSYSIIQLAMQPLLQETQLPHEVHELNAIRLTVSHMHEGILRCIFKWFFHPFCQGIKNKI